MPNTITPNMGLIVPSAGQEPGPTYATDINTSLSTIDQHDHTSGNGVQLTPLSLNINSDLTFMSNNAVSLRSVRFTPQGSPLAAPTDLGCIYEAGVDLYYNDGNGNQVRITSGGSVAGSSGNITGLVPPASASYNSGTKTFIWQSDVNKAANLDAGSVIIRKLTTLSPGITLSPPSSLSADYTLTLPNTPPGSTSLLTMDSSGNVATTRDPSVDTLTLSSDLTVTGTADITGATTMHADLTILGAEVATGLIASNTAIYPTTTSNANLSAFSANGISINNPSDSTSFQVMATTAQGVSLAIAGGVDSTGSTVAGSGFSSVRNALGNYTVTYNSGQFDTGVAPIVIACPAGGATNIAKAIVFSMAATNFVVHMRDGGGSNVDGGFNFIALGQRQ